MTMSAQQAQYAAIEFVERVVEQSVRMMLASNGMKGDDQSLQVLPLDEVGARIQVVVHYGDKLQHVVQGEAHLAGFDQGWTDTTLSLTGDASWDIVAKNLGGRGIDWTVEEKEKK